VIFGGGPFGIWFLGFVRGGEFRRSADFQLILARGLAPSLQSIPAVATTRHFSSSWDAVHRGAISGIS